jgi:hypothetical protein
MEELSHYRQVLTTVLSDLAKVTVRDTVETLPVFDSARNSYLLIASGWDGVRRVHHIVAHLRIRNDKIWVEADNTDAEIVQRLPDAGIPKDAIVLAFYSPEKRRYTEFAVA